VVVFSPKQMFREKEAAKLHHELVATVGFQTAGLHALQAYADMLTKDDKSDAASRMHRLEGAREFWGVLLNLTEVAEMPQKHVTQNLNHRA